ncbi:hypothetical protein QGM61_01285 [Pseudohongiella sp. SYSU M77423]|uniref:hypothetical protein n=1 Tax=Pseudohongiella sp. SYSU M77423 TaxID=3042312 RepID=UPI00247FF4A6|nr:hypothetical protein [Pseudohongiella sp. SYSU M77423]MDH7942440.1 hypothetical protein [Pseudohongiella sp. SYSU M77423]
MLRMKRRAIVTSVSAIALLASFLVPVAYADVSGDWNFAVEIAGVGSGNASVTMQEAADGSITGTYSGQLGNTDFTGNSEGDNFEFVLTSQMGSVTYSGEQLPDGTLAGKLNLGGMGEGTFTATRKE